MANADTPFGLRPVRHRNGAPYNGAANPYYKPAGYATAVFVGDAVVKTGTANTAEVDAPGLGTFNIATLPEINRATVGDGNRITGVVVGFGADPDNLSRVYSPASTEAVVWVADDPDLTFEIQADGAIAATQIGLNAVLIDTHSGDTNTGLSGTELDTTSDAPAADASNQLVILRQVNRIDNEPNLIHNKVLVQISNHTEASGNTAATDGILGV